MTWTRQSAEASFLGVVVLFTRNNRANGTVSKMRKYRGSKIVQPGDLEKKERVLKKETVGKFTKSRG